MPTTVHRTTGGAGSASGRAGAGAPSNYKRPDVDNICSREGSSSQSTNAGSTSSSSTTIATTTASLSVSTTKTAVAVVAAPSVEQKSKYIKRQTVLRQIATTLGDAWRPKVFSTTTSSAQQQPLTSQGRSSTRIRKVTQHYQPSTAPTINRTSVAFKKNNSTESIPPRSARGHRQHQLQQPKTRISTPTLPKPKITQHDQELQDAAHASRLHAHGLCQEEFDIFQSYLRRGDLPAYLAVRNTILWLWRTNPKHHLSFATVFGKTKDLGLHNGLIYPIYEFLLRSGYINFGLFREATAIGLDDSIHGTSTSTLVLSNHKNDGTSSSENGLHRGVGESKETSKHKQKTIVIVGAGIAGIGCARQLTHLFETYRDRFWPDPPPKVVVLEARSRIGGRMHTVEIETDKYDKITKMDSSTHRLHCPTSGQPAPAIVDPRPPDYTRSLFPHAVDLGAQIITGFDNGNPMEIIVRRQLTDLGLYYLGEKPCDLFGPDGKPVDKALDETCEDIFNDILEKACSLRHSQNWPRPLVEYLKKRQEQQTSSTLARHLHPTLSNTTAPSQEHRRPRAEHAKQHKTNHKTDLDDLQASATLGVCMDYFVEHHPDFDGWTDHELELIHWHYANLEFANATPLDKLSLKNWDQDDDFEFSGQHCMVVGGYGQVPLALSTGLDIRLNKPVAKILTDNDEERQPQSSISPVRIQCRDGSTLDCSAAVITVPLGVLKSGGDSRSFAYGSSSQRSFTAAKVAPQYEGIRFEPDLPDWKRKAINHLGFGLLNKLVLVFPKHFWDKAVELFGYVRSASSPSSHPKSSGTPQPHNTTMYCREAYESCRGKFYMFWNCINVSGLPTLVTLLAGQSAYESEETDRETLVQEALETLGRIFPDLKPLPKPVHTIVTRWSADEFARGSYSFVGQDGTGHDYDLMAKPVKNQLYFAGEATSRHYPATAHGAYLSGLKVAADILTSFIGPLTVEGSVAAAAAAAKAEAAARQGQHAVKMEEDEEEKSIDMDVDSFEADDNIVSSASSPLRSFGDAHTEESPPPDHLHRRSKRAGSEVSSSSSSGAEATSATSLGHGFVMPHRRWGRASKKMIARFVADRSHHKYKTGMLASASSEDEQQEAQDEDEDEEEEKETDDYHRSNTKTNGAATAVTGTKRRRRSSIASNMSSSSLNNEPSFHREQSGPSRGTAKKLQTSRRSVGRPRKNPVAQPV